MPGYANRTVRLDFPELGDNVHLVVRNPLTAPPEMLRADVDAGLPAAYAVTSKLAKSGLLYDATSDEDDQPLLEFPLTPETAAKLPLVVINRVSKLYQEAVNPQ